MSNRGDKKILKTYTILFIAFIIMFLIFSIFVYNFTSKTMKEQVSNQCLGISISVAEFLEEDIEGYKEFSNTLDTDSEYYKKTKKLLEDIRYQNENIAFLYTEKKVSDDEIMYILDAEYEDAELFSPPGTIDKMITTNREAFEHETIYAGKEFEGNQYGKLLNSYAPIHDTNGEVVGMVGVDISADQYRKIVLVQVATLLVSLALFIIIILLLGRYILRIHREKIVSDEGSRSKTNFLATMSHEIRTPMNAITGMTELILRENLTPKVRDQALNIRQASHNLLSIINDTLDITKIESGKMEITESNYFFSSMINDVINVIRMRISSKPILFTAYIDPSMPNNLIGDELRVRQILMNVLSNAVKYTEEGRVSIHVSYEDNPDDDSILLTIKISDTGIGIKKEDLEKLFGEFVQFDTIKNKNIEGTGLGLAITHHLCTLMDGEIKVESAYGEGSIFTVTLPQKVDNHEPIAKVNNPDDIYVLINEARGIYAESIALSLRELGVKYDLVDTRLAFNDALQNNKYTHIFSSAFFLSNVERILKQLEITDVKSIYLCEQNEISSISSDKLYHSIPTYAIPLANLFNGEANPENPEVSKMSIVGFTAPTAKILIVDDVRTNLLVAEGLLSPYKMIIHTAESGIEALSLVKANRYDLIFMDHMMPKMDGIETTEEIRKIKDNSGYAQSVPIIALTANAISGVKEIFIKNGMNDYLAKPIDTLKMYGILDKYIPVEKREKFVEEEKNTSNLSFKIIGINIESGLAMCNNDENSYIRVLKAFYLDSKEKQVQLQETIENKDFALFTTHIHAMKSALANIGANILSERARNLELAGAKEDVDFIEDNYDMFMSQLAFTTDKIGQHFAVDSANTCSESNNSSENDAELLNILQELKEAISKIDIPSMDNCLSRLRNGDWEATTAEKLTSIDQNILLFEYDNAKKIIDDMLEQ